nr:vegetative cell wall protein gp1-like [Procambarus clarkii]
MGFGAASPPPPASPPSTSLPLSPQPAPSRPPMPVPSLHAASPVPLNICGEESPAVCGPVPPAVEAVVLRGRALKVRPLESSAVLRDDEGDSSDDRQPPSPSARGGSGVCLPLRGVPWVEMQEYVDPASPVVVGGAVGGSMLPPESPPMPTADDSPRWEVAPAERDLIVVLQKDVR